MQNQILLSLRLPNRTIWKRNTILSYRILDGLEVFLFLEQGPVWTQRFRSFQIVSIIHDWHKFKLLKLLRHNIYNWDLLQNQNFLNRHFHLHHIFVDRNLTGHWWL